MFRMQALRKKNIPKQEEQLQEWEQQPGQAPVGRKSNNRLPALAVLEVRHSRNKNQRLESAQVGAEEFGKRDKHPALVLQLEAQAPQAQELAVAQEPQERQPCIGKDNNCTRGNSRDCNFDSLKKYC